MFAAATREVVFSNREVVRRINADFVPVALKAGLVNNPPLGVEGDLYAEIGRSKPAPQGICVANSAGKSLAWALSFDDKKSIVEFLDYSVRRYNLYPDATKAVTTERFRKFPSRKLTDVRDNGRIVNIPNRHTAIDRCPARPKVERGTLVGRIIGRALDEDGKPVADTIRQEHYMEARFEIPIGSQRALAEALAQSKGKRFQLPSNIVQGIVAPAYLGQLDVDPLRVHASVQTDIRNWKFWGRKTASDNPEIHTIRFEGESEVAAGQRTTGLRNDGRVWKHQVKLKWEGFIDLKDNQITNLVAIARGKEKLHWGNSRLRFANETDAEHLMAGHAIDLECNVRYGVVASPAPATEVVERSARSPDASVRSSRRKLEQRLVGMLGPRFIVLMERVWDELQVSDDQRIELAKLRDSESSSMTEQMTQLQRSKPREHCKQLEELRRTAMKRLDGKLTDILDPRQQQRLAEIALQQHGLFALGQTNIQKQLDLNNEQLRKFTHIGHQMQQQFSRLRQEFKSNPRQLQQRMMSIRQKREGQIRRLLTDSQLTKWNRLIGKPFDVHQLSRTR